MDFIEGEDGIETRRKFDLEFEFKEVYSWLKALRLFKPGALRAGGIWNLAIGAHNNQFIAVQKSSLHPENATVIYGRVTSRVRARGRRSSVLTLPRKELFDLRALLRHSHQWVRMRTRIQNVLQSIALANGLRRGRACGLKQANRRSLRCRLGPHTPLTAEVSCRRCI